MGFQVTIESTVWSRYHKPYSLFVLRTISWNLVALLPNQKIRRFQYEGITVTIGPNTLPAFLYLPFMLVHEYLHFVIGYYSKHYAIMALVPPVLDACYLPAIIIFRFSPFNIWFFVMLYFAWVFIYRLGWNFSGDFAPYLRKIKRKRNEPDTTQEDVTSPVLASTEGVVGSKGPYPD